MRCTGVLAGMVILGGAVTFAQAAGQKDVVTPPGYAFTPNFSEYYPPKSRDAGEEGLVKVRICYDTKGRVQNANVDESSGIERLDEAAIRAGRDVIIKPGTINGIPQEGCVVIPARFGLKDPATAEKVIEALQNPGGAATDKNRASAQLTYMPTIRSIYPSESRKKGEEGTAMVVVCYNKKGKVVSSKLYSSSGFQLLDEAAVRAGNKFRLDPAIVDGVPQEGCGVIPLKFSRKP